MSVVAVCVRARPRNSVSNMCVNSRPTPRDVIPTKLPRITVWWWCQGRCPAQGRGLGGLRTALGIQEIEQELMKIKKKFPLIVCFCILLSVFDMRLYAKNSGEEKYNSSTRSEETINALSLKLKRLTNSLQKNEFGSLFIPENEQKLQQIRLTYTQMLILSCQAHNLQTGVYAGCGEHNFLSLVEQQIPLVINMHEFPSILLSVAVELYKADNGHYPSSLQQLSPQYLTFFSEEKANHYIRPSSDTEASWMNMRYYPPKDNQDTYTLLHDFPVQGQPNIGRLRTVAELALPLIQGLETYHHEYHKYPQNIRTLGSEIYPDHPNRLGIPCLWRAPGRI